MGNTQILTHLMEKAIKESYTDSNKGLELAKELYNRAERIHAHEFLFQALYLIGCCYSQLGKPQEAIHALEQAHYLQLVYFPNDMKKHSMVNNEIGVIYFFQYRLDVALEYYLAALDGNISKYKTSLLNNIAIIYSRKEDYETSLHYTQLAIDFAEKEDNSYSKAGLLFNSIISLIFLGELSLAQEKLQLLEQLVADNEEKDTRFHHITPSMLVAQAIILNRKKEYKAAEEIIQTAISQLKELKLEIYLSMAYQQKAEIHLAKQEYDKAIETGNQALEYAEKFQLYYEQKKILELFVEHYKTQKDWQNALVYTEKLHQLIQTFFERTRELDFQQIVTNRKYLLERQNETQKQLKEQTSFIEQFSHVISHDLKEPIRNIVSFSNLLKRRYGVEIGPEGKEFIENISRRANKMNQSLIRLVEFTSLQKTFPFESSKNSLSSIILYLKNIHEKSLSSRRLVIDYPEKAFIVMEREHAISLWDEIIGNAIKFRQPKKDCEIYIQFFQTEHDYKYIITDYGQGLDMKHKEDVFQVFYKLNRGTEGLGLGLPICERIVKLYQGQIHITSEKGKYTTIHIQLPILKKWDKF